MMNAFLSSFLTQIERFPFQGFKRYPSPEYRVQVSSNSDNITFVVHTRRRPSFFSCLLFLSPLLFLSFSCFRAHLLEFFPRWIAPLAPAFLC
jgi:hypothetical protein